MFLNRIQVSEDVMGIAKLVYPSVFQSISPFVVSRHEKISLFLLSPLSLEGVKVPLIGISKI